MKTKQKHKTNLLNSFHKLLQLFPLHKVAVAGELTKMFEHHLGVGKHAVEFNKLINVQGLLFVGVGALAEICFLRSMVRNVQLNCLMFNTYLKQNFGFMFIKSNVQVLQQFCNLFERKRSTLVGVGFVEVFT